MKTKNDTGNIEEAPARPSSSWGHDRRLSFIDFRLRWEGRINRSDLTDFFGISVPQASLDIAKYSDLAPQNLSYDRSSRAYHVTPEFAPLTEESHTQKYLSELLAMSTGVIDHKASFIGWKPPMDSVPQPGRMVEPRTLAALLKAIREKAGLRVVYQSMSSPEPGTRVISPHALAHDGFRWHVRAFCHSRQQFRDFVLGRIIEIQCMEPTEASASDDHEWNTVLKLVLAPHPGLPEAKRRAIELDYEMRNGEVTLECRHALLFYTLKQLGLTNSASQSPEAQQIILKNQAELSSFLGAT